jgi:hypothetical protein
MPGDAAYTKGQNDMSSTYWDRMGAQESPLTAGISPYSPSLHHGSHSNWAPGSDPASREEIGWSSGAPRSISFSHHDNLSHNSTFPSYHHQGTPSNIRDEFNSRAQAASQSDLYAPSLTPGANSMSGTEASSTSTAAETNTPQHTSVALPNASYPGPPQPWPTYSYSKSPALPSGGEGFGSWYSPATVAQPQGHAESMPPTTYGQTESYGGMYYSTTQGR